MSRNKTVTITKERINNNDWIVCRINKDIDQAFMITENKVSVEVFNHLALL